MSRSFQGCGTIEQLVALRFQVHVDPGASIIESYITFHVDVGNLAKPGHDESAPLEISVQDHTNPPTFDGGSVTSDISDRTYHSPSVSWDPEVWEADPAEYNTADISELVQYIVDQPGWSSGNSMVFKIHGSPTNPGFRSADSHDAGNPPKLYVHSESRRLLQLTCTQTPSLLASILASKFTGASGFVSFGKDYRNGRDTDGFTVGVYRIGAKAGNQGYELSLVSTWNEISGMIDLGDSGYPVGVLRRILNHNYIWFRSRVIGLSLMGFAWLIALASIVMLRRLRHEIIIQRAQPFFMQTLCLGSVITSATIFALSWDEDANWTNRQLSNACAITPWLFFIGQSLMFGSMFVKLWRVDRFFHFQEKAVAVGYAGQF